jgi:cytochrome c oxidase assembly protein subunit 15
MDVARGFNLAQGIGPNYLGGLLEGEARTAIHMAHRLGALVVSVSVLLLVIRLLRIGKEAKVLGFTLLAVLLLQVSLGITNVAAHLPLTVAVAHNAGGALLLLVLVTLTHRVYSAQSTTACIKTE